MFKTWHDGYNFSLNCVEIIRANSGDKLCELGADTVLEHHTTETVTFRDHDRIVSIKAETSGNWAAALHFMLCDL